MPLLDPEKSIIGEVVFSYYPAFGGSTRELVRCE